MNLRPTPLTFLTALVLFSTSLLAQQHEDEGHALQPLAPSALPTPSPTPADPAPPALTTALTAFARDELAAQQQDDPGKITRFYLFPLEDEGRPTNAADFKRAWTDYTRKFTHRTLETITAKVVAYDPATDTAEIQQTYGSETQPAGHPDSEKKLMVRQLHVIHAGQPGRVIDRRFTVKEFWTYDTQLSEADFPTFSHPVNDPSDEDYIKSVIAQDRANYSSGRHDPDDQPCAYFDDPAHRALLMRARLRIIPDTPATRNAVLDRGSHVRVSFSDNRHGENRDGYPVLNVGVLDR